MRPGRATLLLTTALLLVVLVAMPVSARTVEVGVAAGSWYLTATSSAPVVPPVAGEVNPYPDDTLHVGVVAGREEARAYVTLDLSAAGVDADAVIGGRLILPVLPEAGSRSPDAAVLRVCTAGPVDDGVRGSTEAPPPAECAVGSPARYSAETATFEVDLSPLVGFLDRGLAVVPAAGDMSANWHAAFPAPEHGGDAHITARLIVDDGDDADVPFAAEPPAPPAPLDSYGFASAIHPESAFVGAAPAVGIGTQAPAAIAPRIAPATTVRTEPQTGAPIATSTPEGFKYSVIFALPLLVLIGVPYFGYALTGPIDGQRLRDRRALKSS